MAEEGLSGPHGVLMGAEFREMVFNEVIECLQRLLAIHRPIEIFQVSRMVTEYGLDQLDDISGQWIRTKCHPRFPVSRSGFAERLPVAAVVIPFSSRRLVAIHEHIMIPAHLAIEVLHAQLPAPGRPPPEIVYAAEKMSILTDLKLQAVDLADLLNLPEDRMLPGVGHNNAFRRMRFKETGNRLPERCCGVAVLHFFVGNRDSHSP